MARPEEEARPEGGGSWIRPPPLTERRRRREWRSRSAEIEEVGREGARRVKKEKILLCGLYLMVVGIEERYRGWMSAGKCGTEEIISMTKMKYFFRRIEIEKDEYEQP